MGTHGEGVDMCGCVDVWMSIHGECVTFWEWTHKRNNEPIQHYQEAAQESQIWKHKLLVGITCPTINKPHI